MFNLRAVPTAGRRAGNPDLRTNQRRAHARTTETHASHPPGSGSESIQWLEDMFLANEIALVDFAITLRIIMNCEDEKINTLVLYGPTNTGKSLICKLTTTFLEHGSVMRRQGASAFAYENLLNRKVALMEEPGICAANQQDLKQILGGETFKGPKDMQTTQQAPQPVQSTAQHPPAPATPTPHTWLKGDTTTLSA
ncbi:Non-capsid protein NS-1 [Echinococcus granulosus]|uniref:Non-capsid protein NS-1 n=1 Tax=Echinococcus granulosus TaxID=6210 RepID=W6UKP4_ECHGR|nr:Non-capsid protein NS-1 [Echinococcus granulosus]EUB54064.1 Non-capsid protein NS-1 [Echinococcus granulosus]